MGAAGGPAQLAFDHTHGAWTTVLKAHVRDGALDYAALEAQRAAFDGYLAALHAVTPEELGRWSEAQRFAFWINAYNAHCAQRVLDAYPLASIRRLDGAFGLNTAFDQGFVPMRAHLSGAEEAGLSLNDLQDGILRKRFRDARVHAALHNSTRSGAPLRPEAYTADALERQLDEQMRAFVNDPTRNRIDPAGKQLALSEVFKWFAEDFERDGKTLQDFLVRYAPAEAADFIRGARPRSLPYDWALADAGRK